MTSKWQPVIRQNSRAGCSKCKERRIKCDRKYPSCQNCTSRFLTCPGYETTYRWKEKHQIRPSGSVSPPSSSGSRPTRKLLVASSSIQDHQGQVHKEQAHQPVHPFLSLEPNDRTKKHAGRLFAPDDMLRIANRLTPSPSHYRPQTPTDDGARRLIWHYFHFVCSINSCSDSPVDSMRTVTQGLMSSSRLVYFCVLSMSAAHLHRVHPGWSGESLVYLTRAISTLRAQLNNVLEKASASASAQHELDQALFGIIFLGMSTSWHNASELGLEHIIGSRILLQTYVCPRLYNGSAPDRRKLSFFIGLQIYWETVASFLLDQELDQLDYLHEACIELSPDTIYVHPWTGISSTSWILLAKAGCIARHRLRLLAECSDAEGAEVSSPMDKLMQQARLLEAQLLSCELPQASSISNSCTEHASVLDLYRIARCCKYAALLELYKAFGCMWDTQSAFETLTKEWYSWEEALGLSECQDTFIYADIYELLSLGILRILRCISTESSTRCLQPFLLLIAGSSLSDTATEQSPQATVSDFDGSSTEGTSAQDPECLTAGHAAAPAFLPCSPPQVPQTQGTPSNLPEVSSTWRRFVYERITFLEEAIKLDSLRRIRMILLEVWASDDRVRRMEPSSVGDGMTQHVHWINVMEEKQLQFMF